MAYAYPSARRDDTVDEFFGHKVPDPYRWMEDPASPEVRSFIDAQNVLSQAYLDTPERAAIKQRLKTLYGYPHVPAYRAAVRRGRWSALVRVTARIGFTGESRSGFGEVYGSPPPGRGPSRPRGGALGAGTVS